MEAPEYTIKVLGEPVAWARQARNKDSGGKFTPAKQQKHQGKIMDAWERAGHPRYGRDTPMLLSAQFYVPRLSAHFTTGRNAGVIKNWARSLRPCKRPDLSNCLKMVEDALTTLAWIDDDQVVGYYDMGKFYVEGRDDPPYTLIRVKPAVLGAQPVYFPDDYVAETGSSQLDLAAA